MLSFSYAPTSTVSLERAKIPRFYSIGQWLQLTWSMLHFEFCCFCTILFLYISFWHPSGHHHFTCICMALDDLYSRLPTICFKPMLGEAQNGSMSSSHPFYKQLVFVCFYPHSTYTLCILICHLPLSFHCSPYTFLCLLFVSKG